MVFDVQFNISLLAFLNRYACFNCYRYLFTFHSFFYVGVLIYDVIARSNTVHLDAPFFFRSIFIVTLLITFFDVGIEYDMIIPDIQTLRDQYFLDVESVFVLTRSKIRHAIMLAMPKYKVCCFCIFRWYSCHYDHNYYGIYVFTLLLRLLLIIVFRIYPLFFIIRYFFFCYYYIYFH